MSVREPRGHRTLVERLWRATREGRLPHALLLEGPEGIGKFVAARWFAAGFLCAEGPGEPCGTCGPCKRLVSGGDYGNHPGYFLIDSDLEDEERIRVHRIAYRPDTPRVSDPERCVEMFLDLKIMEGSGRIVLIRESHRMNPAAQNALLKTLEEPRPGTLLLLETHRSELLLPTIKSRCVRVRLDPLTGEDCAAVLAAEGFETERAARLARWSSGAPGRAVLFAARGGEELRDLVAEVLAGRCTPHFAAAKVWEVEGRFPGKTPLAKLRSRARVLLDLLLAVTTDLRRHAAGLDGAALAHGDLAAHLEAVGDQDLATRLEALLEIRADVDRNLGPEALVERAFLACAPRAPIL